MTNMDLIVLADECVSAEDVERMVEMVERVLDGVAPLPFCNLTELALGTELL